VAPSCGQPIGMRSSSRHLVDVLRVVERARALHAERRPTSFETIDRWIARQDRRFMSRPEAMRKVDGRGWTIRRIDDRNVPKPGSCGAANVGAVRPPRQIGQRKDLRLSVRHSVRRWRLSAAQTSNVSIGNGQRGKCGSVIYCKLRKNVVQVNFDGSCGEIELPPHLCILKTLSA
jgi:hypothetical protein